MFSLVVCKRLRIFSRAACGCLSDEGMAACGCICVDCCPSNPAPDHTRAYTHTMCVSYRVHAAVVLDTAVVCCIRVARAALLWVCLHACIL